MNIIEFKQILKTVIKKYGFEFHNNRFYFDSSNLIVVIDTQKSNYDNYYYINFGFCLKELHKDVHYPKSFECDIACRFLNNESKGIYQLDMLSCKEFSENLEKNIEDFIVPVINNDINEFFILFPQYYSLASLRLKEFLKH